ncbi:hypothetical protein ID866_8265 [Astraeus odoratus]|nr:hypothetical protein ID866_8265 [Astraeus odoratus]
MLWAPARLYDPAVHSQSRRTLARSRQHRRDVPPDASRPSPRLSRAIRGCILSVALPAFPRGRDNRARRRRYDGAHIQSHVRCGRGPRHPRAGSYKFGVRGRGLQRRVRECRVDDIGCGAVDLVCGRVAFRESVLLFWSATVSRV